MYIDYVNYIVNANREKVRKPEVVLDLQKVYEGMKVGKRGKIIIEDIKVCANSAGCNPKKKDFLVVSKTNEGEIRTNLGTNASKYVLMLMNGKIEIGGQEQNIHVRIPRSGVVGIRIGMRNQERIRLFDSAVDEKLREFGEEVTRMIINMIPGLEKVRETKLVGVSAKGFNIFNPKTGERPEKKVKNFVTMLRKIDEGIETHYLDYNYRDGRQIIRGNFKPHDKGATIGITVWGMTDFMGNTTVKEILKLWKVLVKAVEDIREGEITYDEGSVYVDKKTKCSKRNPAPINGQCPKGMSAKQDKKGNTCCYKTKQRNVSVKVGKIDMKRCMRLNKEEIEQIARKMQINPTGFKKDVCKRIISKNV